MRSLRVLLVVASLSVFTGRCLADWKPADGPLMTRWAKEVSPESVHPEYPRPQMARNEWLNLNGLWEYSIVAAEQARPEKPDGQILVPFPAESALSGVMRTVGEENRLWYRRTFRVPGDWSGRRVLLHFEAVDWETIVWVNGEQVGSHKGGYDPFTFDVTKALQDGAENELLLAVWDPTNKGTQPRGKQVVEPRGIWYTSVTGIWRTVWLEPVPAASVAALGMVTDVDAGTLQLTAQTSGAEPTDTIRAVATDGDAVVATADAPVGKALTLRIAKPKRWTPDSPFLYGLEVSLIRNGKPIDQVESYFGMRKIALGKDDRGIVRMMLNDEFVFQYGPLMTRWAKEVSPESVHPEYPRPQ
ncbi:MAG: glycoside hydrolase family 2 protein, partial [Planctomycetota bacterium]